MSTAECFSKRVANGQKSQDRKMLGVLEGSSRYKSRVAKEGKSEVREVVGTQL
jgi:hypothetical protein